MNIRALKDDTAAPKIIFGWREMYAPFAVDVELVMEGQAGIGRGREQYPSDAEGPVPTLVHHLFPVRRQLPLDDVGHVEGGQDFVIRPAPAAPSPSPLGSTKPKVWVWLAWSRIQTMKSG